MPDFFSKNYLKVINVTAAGASCLLLAGLAFLLIFDSADQNINSPILKLRDMEIALPPPPPPQEIQQPQQNSHEPVLELSQIGEGPVIEVASMNIVDVLEDITILNPVQENYVVEWNQELNVDWSAFGLGELDTPPQVITTQAIIFPPNLTRRNIHRAIVRLDVFIDENGLATLIKIVENPYKELANTIHSIVRSTRFSPPLKNGQAVRARFIWPLEIVE